MKKVIFSAIVALFLNVPLAQAYFVDGDLSDWGVTLNAASKIQGYLDTHHPTGGNDIDHVSEDNADLNSGFAYVGPGYTIGNIYDAEAIFFDNDAANAYIAIVTGTPKTGVQFLPGDIFIDTGKYQDPSSGSYNAKKYGFGIDISNGKLYSVDSWQDVYYPQFNSSNPWKIGSNKTYLGDVEFVYGNDVNTHHVLEAKVPLSLLGIKGNSDAWVHWVMECGNDPLSLHGDVNAIPEPATVLLLGGGFLIGGVRKLRAQKKV